MSSLKSKKGKIKEIRENNDCCCRRCGHLKSHHLHKIGNLGSSECYVEGCECKKFEL
jgi:hypothetical protein